MANKDILDQTTWRATLSFGDTSEVVEVYLNFVWKIHAKQKYAGGVVLLAFL